MSTLTNDIAPETQAPRSRMLWVLFAVIAAAQLFAFWLLCSHQVRKAEARRNEVVVQQMALSDCLQYIPGSTIASCSARDDVTAQAAPVSRKSALSGAVPVSFSFR
jgi:bacteriorhodopsin